MALEFAANHIVSLRTCLHRILGAEILAESWEVAVAPVVAGWIGPPEWAKGESSGPLVQLGGLFGDHRKTAACRGRTVGDSVDQRSIRIIP